MEFVVHLDTATWDLLERRASMTHREAETEAALLLGQVLETWQLQDALQRSFRRSLALSTAD